jgi:tetratricopeptide (TPR) repeat protein
LDIARNVEYASALHKRGLLAEAQTVLEGILEAQPKHFGAIFLLGLISAQTRNVQRAAELFAAAADIQPDNAPAHCNRGVALAELGQFDAALASYDRAIAIGADHAEAYLNRGVLFAELGRVDLALPNYDQAIAIKADFAETHLNLDHAVVHPRLALDVGKRRQPLVPLRETIPTAERRQLGWRVRACEGGFDSSHSEGVISLGRCQTMDVI